MRWLLGFLGLSAPATQPAAATVDSNPAAELGRAPKSYTVADAVPGKDGVKRMAILRGLDKITGQAVNIDAPIGVPVRYATLTITAEYCYSTPPSETPETTAFLQIVDQRPEQAAQPGILGLDVGFQPLAERDAAPAL